MNPFTSLTGAVIEAGTVSHFGHPFAEQRAWATGGVAPRLDRVAFSLRGPDRLAWLDSISSQSIRTLAVGESAESLILDPHGHIEFVVHLVAAEEELWLITDRPRADGLAMWLTRMRFRAEVELIRRDDLVVVATNLPRDDIAAIVSWHDPWPATSAGGFSYQDGHEPWGYLEHLIERSAAEALAQRVTRGELGAVGSLAVTAARIAAGRPDPADLDDRALPHEFDWLRTAVHLDKGCYRGQETVAKVLNLGRPPRRLVRLMLDGSTGGLPAAGDPVINAANAIVGRVTAAARHADWGPIALALVQRQVPDGPGVEVSIRGVDSAESEQVSAHVEGIVPADAGPRVHIDRSMPRFLGRR